MSVEVITNTENNFGVTRASQGFVTLRVVNQLFGIPILQVQDVLSEQKITKIPVSSPEIAGALNLRGRIVTAIDVRRTLALPDAQENESENMNVVVELDGELYSLIVDSIGEVLNLYEDDCEKNPSTLDVKWKKVAGGVYRLDKELLVVLDVKKMLSFGITEDV